MPRGKRGHNEAVDDAPRQEEPSSTRSRSGVLRSAENNARVQTLTELRRKTEEKIAADEAADEGDEDGSEAAEEALAEKPAKLRRLKKAASASSAPTSAPAPTPVPASAPAPATAPSTLAKAAPAAAGVPLPPARPAAAAAAAVPAPPPPGSALRSPSAPAAPKRPAAKQQRGAHVYGHNGTLLILAVAAQMDPVTLPMNTNNPQQWHGFIARILKAVKDAGPRAPTDTKWNLVNDDNLKRKFNDLRGQHQKWLAKTDETGGGSLSMEGHPWKYFQPMQRVFGASPAVTYDTVGEVLNIAGEEEDDGGGGPSSSSPSEDEGKEEQRAPASVSSGSAGAIRKPHQANKLEVKPVRTGRKSGTDALAEAMERSIMSLGKLLIPLLAAPAAVLPAGAPGILSTETMAAPPAPLPASGMTCVCGSRLEPDYAFCPSCTLPVRRPAAIVNKTCCGKTYNPQARICAICGRRFV